MDKVMDIFLVAPPGLERVLAEEAGAKGFATARAVVGGVETRGDWRSVWRANLELRGAVRVLVRLGGFRAMHLAQLDKRARKFPWGDVLRADVAVRVEAVCRKSKIYHARAAQQRVERAISETLGAPIGDGGVVVKVRIEDDFCLFSLDSSGESLHIRGHKEYVGKAPMRESMAAMFLRDCGFDGAEPVVDPMCGSGTFVIEAAEIAAGLQPGRSRRFAFEDLALFDAGAWAALKSGAANDPGVRFYGFDRDDGAIRGSVANAERAGVAEWTAFKRQAVSELTPPEGPRGLVMVNPPYGSRIGNRKLLFGLYGALGKVLVEQFGGWRVGLVTSDSGLAKATGLRFEQPAPPVAFGGLKVTLWKTGVLSDR